jgi:hypothetical protein
VTVKVRDVIRLFWEAVNAERSPTSIMREIEIELTTSIIPQAETHANATTNYGANCDCRSF